MRRGKAPITTIGLMAVALLLPFFGTHESGCRPVAAFPCEAEPMVVAASGLLSDWSKQYGAFYDLSLESFPCPHKGRLTAGEVVPPYTRFGGTICGDHEYWESREKERAGRELRAQLLERFRAPRPAGPELPPRSTGQVDAELVAACTPDPSPEALNCELTARLIIPEPEEGAPEAPPPMGPTTRSTAVTFALARTDHRPLDQQPPWGDLWRQMTRASLMPIGMVDKGIEALDIVYLFFLLMVCGAFFLEVRWRWPRTQLALGVTNNLAAILLVAAFINGALEGCEGYFAFAPSNTFYAFWDRLLYQVQIGFLLYGAAAFGNTALSARRWWAGRRGQRAGSEGSPAQ